MLQLLVLAVFLTIKAEPEMPGAARPAIRWLYLPPLSPEQMAQTDLEVAPEIVLETEPEDTADEEEEPRVPPSPYLSPQELRIVSIPDLRPQASSDSTFFFDAFRAYLSCDLDNYASLSGDARAQCDTRLAALRRERDLLDPEKLPFLLTAGEQAQWQQWARDAGERHAPALLPCLGEHGLAAITVGTVECLLAGLSDGFDPANNPANRYAPAP